ncbi:MAG: TolB family protein [Gemmatimonadaceae bacterium]
MSADGGPRLLPPNTAEGLPQVSREAALDALERVLSSAAFHGAERSSTLLRFVVDQTLGGNADRLKEYTVGVDALGRGASFDPRIDPIVRAEASRLRTRLERYYATDGRADPLVISLPKGSYVPQFRTRTVDAPDIEAPGRSSGTAPSRRWPVAALAIGGALAVVLIALASWLAGRRTGRSELPLAQFDVELRADGSLGSEVGTDVVISRDGTRLAFVSVDSSSTAHLYVRRLDQAAASALPGTEGARGPFFSPDGQWIGYWAAGRLKKVAVTGGSPVVLSDATDLLGASWGDDETIIAVLNSTGALWRVPAAGGAPTRVTTASATPSMHAWPQLLHNGSAVLYTNVAKPGADRATIEVLSLRDGSRKVLVNGGTYGRYLSGYLTYVNQGTLYAAPFDVDRLTLGSPAVPVLDDIAYSPTFGYAQMDVSKTGTLVYRRAAGTGRTLAVWLDSAGVTQPLVDTPGRYFWPRLSPDGQRLALAVVDGGLTAVSFYERSGGRTTRVSGPAQHSASVWSPDARFVVMSGATGISWMPAAGGTPQPLVQSGAIQVPWTFTPNGDRLAFHEMNPATGMDLWTVPIRSDEHGLSASAPEPLIRTRSFEVYPSFSPDGRWVAYGSNESGAWEVYVRPFRGDGPRVQVSNGGGRVPRWSPNGRDLFYATDDQRIMVVRYKTKGASLNVSPPRLWSRVDLADTGVLPNYDLAPDGRIIALVPATPGVKQSQNHVTVMLNFFDELRRRTALPRR